MQRFIIHRLWQSLIVLLGISVFTFVIARVVGDPVQILLPMDATQADYLRYKHLLGLDKPIYEQYAIWILNILRGDFGESYRWHAPALQLIVGRFPATIQLGVASMAIAWLIALPVGILSALRPGGWMDTFGKALALAGQAIPNFWLGIVLMLIFAVTFRLLPVAGVGGPQNLILPAFSMCWASLAAVLRITRSSMLDVLDSEYIKMARIKGLAERLVIGKHAFKNASIPIVTIFGLQFARVLSGTVIIETIFAWPGVGKMAIDAIYASDYNVVQAMVLITSSMMVFANFAVDVIYAFLDPRIRYQ